MSKYYSISGRVELYDFEKFRDWLFEELQKQDFVGTFDIGIDKEYENRTLEIPNKGMSS